ncbi:MAG: hypothetical protein OHK0053_03590 [Microscillaceae bacterium]
MDYTENTLTKNKRLKNMEVYKSAYWSIFYNEEWKLLTPVWNNNSENLTEGEYKAEMENYVELVEKHRPKQL